MGISRFPIPADLQQTIRLLNQKGWNLSLVEQSGQIHLIDGDQVQFITETDQEVIAFLAGVFLATFEGQSLDDVMRTMPPS